MKEFNEGYSKLNKEQKEAVDKIEGPVMVIAGPGTGKTQILTLRIANILDKTDTPPDGILCLTFTNSGVFAMRERLFKLIGPTANKISINTFHSFSYNLIEKNFDILGFEELPSLLDDHDSVLLADKLLETGDWKHLRTRNTGAHNFGDLKSLASFLRKEKIKPEDFCLQVESEIKFLKEDPSSISSRGETKGKIKKEIEGKIESLKRTYEAGLFCGEYEKTKREKNILDYDDILEYAVKLVKESDDVRDQLREQYLYVLVDEHQDSSGIQNEFLEGVWGEVERPNIFTVGDDRQIIYGFSGASLNHFERFQEVFPGTSVISLIQNYRSTQTILDSAEALLTSSLVKNKLSGRKDENSQKVSLIEASYPRDEILMAGIAIKKKIKEGLAPEDCAILVPKNAQVRSAREILKGMNLPVSSDDKVSFFSLPETAFLKKILQVLAEPLNSERTASLLFDPVLNIPKIKVHKFLFDNGNKLSIETLAKGEDEMAELGKRLETLLSHNQDDIYSLVQEIGQIFLFDKNIKHEVLMRNIESVRTMLHLVLSKIEKDKNLDLKEFVSFLKRLEEYGQDFPLAVFSANEGIKIMTLHSSKGLEYEFVWIAHLDEKSVMGHGYRGFVLPEKLKEIVYSKDELTAKRELYVAITRAKSFCNLSFSNKSYNGSKNELASIIRDIPEEFFLKKDSGETEKEILAENPKLFVESNPIIEDFDTISFAKKIVEESFREKPVSVTHLNNFFSCPWKWYFRNFLRLPEPKTEALTFGSVAHSVVEALIKNRILSESGKIDLINVQLDKQKIFDSNTRDRFVKDIKNIIVFFEKNILPDIKKDFDIEKKLIFRDKDFPEIEITGNIDLIENINEKEIRVTDFKTGKVKSEKEITKLTKEGRLSDLSRQLAMYSYLILNNKEDKKVSSSRLIFLEAEDDNQDYLYQTQIEWEMIELLRKDIKEYYDLLLGGDWVNIPCDFKPNQFEKECPYCALVEPNHFHLNKED